MQGQRACGADGGNGQQIRHLLADSAAIVLSSLFIHFFGTAAKHRWAGSMRHAPVVSASLPGLRLDDAIGKRFRVEVEMQDRVHRIDDIGRTLATIRREAEGWILTIRASAMSRAAALPPRTTRRATSDEREAGSVRSG